MDMNVSQSILVAHIGYAMSAHDQTQDFNDMLPCSSQSLNVDKSVCKFRHL